MSDLQYNFEKGAHDGVEVTMETSKITMTSPQSNRKEKVEMSSIASLVSKPSGKGLEDPTKGDKLSLKQILAASLGNIVEWYDFALYGFFADPIAKTFFKNESKNESVFWTYLIFGGAFVMRPVGGAVCGYIGDTYGRQYALRFTITLMGLSTILLGCLPSADKIGVAAVILLTVARFVQGFAVGGELIGTLTYALENAPLNNKVMAGAAIMTTATLGNWLGAAVSAIWHEAFTPEELDSWAWRIPFLASGVVAFLGWWFRRDMESGSEFEEAKPSLENPFTKAITTQWRAILNIAGMLVCYAVGFYLCFIWTVEWVSSLTDGTKLSHAYDWNLLGMTVFLLAMPTAGFLLNKLRYDPGWGLALAAAVVAVMAPPLFYYVSVTMGTPGPYILMLCLFAGPWGVYGALLGVYMYEATPNARLRYTTIGIAFNLAFAVFGGTCPALATAMLGKFGPLAPGFYVSIVCAISIGSITLFKCCCRRPSLAQLEPDLESGKIVSARVHFEESSSKPLRE